VIGKSLKVIKNFILAKLHFIGQNRESFEALDYLMKWFAPVAITVAALAWINIPKLYDEIVRVQSELLSLSNTIDEHGDSINKISELSGSIVKLKSELTDFQSSVKTAVQGGRIEIDRLIADIASLPKKAMDGGAGEFKDIESLSESILVSAAQLQNVTYRGTACGVTGDPNLHTSLYKSELFDSKNSPYSLSGRWAADRIWYCIRWR